MFCFVFLLRWYFLGKHKSPSSFPPAAAIPRPPLHCIDLSMKSGEHSWYEDIQVVLSLPRDMRAAGAACVLWVIPVVMTEHLLYSASMNDGSIGVRSTLKMQQQLQE